MIPSANFLDKALCAQVGYDVFFTDGQTGEAALNNRNAKRICAACDVRQRCLDMAMSLPRHEDQHGVFGGLTADERNEIRGQRREAA